MSTEEFSMPFRLNEELKITKLLAKALEARNLNDFRDALEKGANPYLPVQIGKVKVGVLEEALESYGCAKFVAECIKDKWDYSDYISPNLQLDTYLTDLQVGSHDFIFFSHLLQFYDIPDELEPTNLTLINSLAKNITTENFDNIFNCIQKLIEYGADPNIPDLQEITPILHIIENRELDNEKKKIIIKYLMDLQYPKIDIDSYRHGQANPRILLRRKYPEIQLPLSDTSELNFHNLSVLLRKKQEDNFIQCFQKYHSNLSNITILDNIKQKNYINLLLTAIRKGLNKAAEVILQTEIDANGEEREYTPAKIACMVGNREVLQMLLQQDNVNFHTDIFFYAGVWLSTTETKEGSELGDYMGCFDAILSSSKIDENETEYFKHSTLHIAVTCKNQRVIKNLLEKGAYFGNKISQERISPKILEEFFDKCITTNGVNHSDDHFRLIINYRNFFFRIVTHHEDMLPIKDIAESESVKHLLKHPLITSYLYLKWHQLSSFFYANFIVSFLSCIFLITYILLDFNNAAKGTMITFKCLSYLGYAYILMREYVQWFSLGRQMFTTKFVAFTNCLEFMFIILTMLTFIHGNYKSEPQRTYAVLTILLASMEIYLLIGSIPILTFSTHMLMLKEVCVSFMKSFSQYFIFFVTFGLCFHIVFRNSENGETLDSDAGYFNSTFGSIFKTLVMVTGEFDSGSINFSSPTSYGIFIFFVTFMAIILLNLLNGLAVSDIQLIRAQAELNGHICCTLNLASLEKCINLLKRTRPFSLFCRNLPTSLSNIICDKIFIMPNISNQMYIIKNCDSNSTSVKSNNQFISITVNDDNNRNIGIVEWLWNSCCNICGKMDFEIIKAALAVIEKKQRLQDEQKITLAHEARLKNIEKNIEIITDLVQKLAENVNNICKTKN